MVILIFITILHWPSGPIKVDHLILSCFGLILSNILEPIACLAKVKNKFKTILGPSIISMASNYLSVLLEPPSFPPQPMSTPMTAQSNLVIS